MYPHRKNFLNRLSNHPRLKHFRLDLTNETRLSITEYANYLNESRVSLCLGGNCSPETFRFFESMQTGCIVVSPKMPSNDLYAGRPGFEIGEIDNPNAVAEVIESILADPQKHDVLQHGSLQTWTARYSPPAVAAMVKCVVDSRINGQPAPAGPARIKVNDFIF